MIKNKNVKNVVINVKLVLENLIYVKNVLILLDKVHQTVYVKSENLILLQLNVKLACICA